MKIEENSLFMGARCSDGDDVIPCTFLDSDNAIADGSQLVHLLLLRYECKLQ